jgi:hypothetical protein
LIPRIVVLDRRQTAGYNSLIEVDEHAIAFLAKALR